MLTPIILVNLYVFQKQTRSHPFALLPTVGCLLSQSDQEIVGLDVPVNEVLGVHVLHPSSVERCTQVNGHAVWRDPSHLDVLLSTVSSRQEGGPDTSWVLLQTGHPSSPNSSHLPTRTSVFNP